MIRAPDWAFEAAGQEMRGFGQDTAYHPGLYLTPTQVILFVLIISFFFYLVGKVPILV
jgi:hypothetical protein